MKRLMTTLMMIFSLSLTHCGIDPEDYKVETEEVDETATDTEAEKETEPEKETPAYEEESLSTKTEVKVDVDVDVTVNTETQTVERPLKFRRGLTMDQILEMFGEPDDVWTSGAGLNWYYDNDEVCIDDVVCSVWFNFDKLVRGSRDLRPEHKDIKNL